MGATTLFIIRHGEKPAPEDPSPGLTPNGAPDPSCLTIRGWQRAGAWAALFGSGVSDDHAAPGLVYASDPSRLPDTDPPSQPGYGRPGARRTRGLTERGRARQPKREDP